MASDEVSRFCSARAQQRALYDAGYAGLSFPAAYGGRGWPPEYQQILNEEGASYDLPIRFSMPTLGIIAPTILEFGTEEQKCQHIPAMLRGDHLWVQFLSEPSCGSDLAGARTTAVRDGSTWLVNGSKVWSSAAYGCDYAICLARTDWDATKYAGLTMFLVKVDQPGITVRRIRQLDGPGEFCEEFFNDLRLTDSDVLGEVNRGWKVATRLLSHERDAVGGSSAFIGSVNTQRIATSGGEQVELVRRAPAPVAAARRRALGESQMLDHRRPPADRAPRGRDAHRAVPRSGRRRAQAVPRGRVSPAGHTRANARRPRRRDRPQRRDDETRDDVPDAAGHLPGRRQ